MLTKTVFGFDEFVTTVGNTVMVFLPSKLSTSPDASSSSSLPVSESVSITSTSAVVTSPLAKFSQNSLREDELKLPLENMFR